MLFDFQGHHSAVDNTIYLSLFVQCRHVANVRHVRVLRPRPAREGSSVSLPVRGGLFFLLDLPSHM